VQANSLELNACIAEVEPMRYTPAGLPALNCRLEHESQMQEAGGIRTVKMSIKAVAFGSDAERLAKQAIGSEWNFKGFLANARQGKSVVFHIQDFLQA
jgi:primosomal replication protein N